MSLPAIKTSAGGLAERLARAARPSVTASAGMTGFLKFDFQSGRYTFGRSQEEVTGDVVLVNTNTICHGWVIWSDSKATKVLDTIDNDLPAAPEPIGGNQPSEARALMGAFYDDGKPGDQLTFETNSFGGRKAVDSLFGEIQRRCIEGETVYLYPLVKLSSESYKNKNYMNKLIHNPVFEIQGWCDINGKQQVQTAAIEHDTEVEEAAPAAPARRRRVA